MGVFCKGYRQSRSESAFNAFLEVAFVHKAFTVFLFALFENDGPEPLDVTL